MLATNSGAIGTFVRTARLLQRQLSKASVDPLHTPEHCLIINRLTHSIIPQPNHSWQTWPEASACTGQIKPSDWSAWIGSSNAMPARAAVSVQQRANLWTASPSIGLSGKAERYSSLAAASQQVAAIKQLRERTGAPMKDVKAVLVACDWDMEAAFTELRKKGLAAASKKKARVAADGLLGLAQEEGCAAVVEVNSETDFVARNGIFQHLVSRVAQAALQVAAADGPTPPASATPISLPALEETLISLDHPQLRGSRLVREALAEVAAITGENIQLRRGFRLAEASGVVGTYLHTSPQPGLARMVGLVGLQAQEGRPGSEELRTLADQLAMHAVAARPLYLRRELVPSEALAKEREVLATQAAGSGKPAAVIEKMVEGRLRKFYEDVVMMEQPFILEESKKVQAIIDTASKAMGAKLAMVAMLRLEVGEGVERIEKDFATEVREQAGQKN